MGGLRVLTGGGIHSENGAEWRPMPLHARSAIGAMSMSAVEFCGYVLSDWTVIVIKNVAPKPYESFQFDEKQQRNIVELHAEEILGMFHTHPSGIGKPSSHDVQHWPVAELRYWIAANGEVSEWTKDGLSVREV